MPGPGLMSTRIYVLQFAIRPRSSRADGALAIFVPGTKSGFKLVLLVYPAGTVEHFLFQLDRAGNGTVAWGTVRGSGMLQKSSLFVAKCRAP